MHIELVFVLTTTCMRILLNISLRSILCCVSLQLPGGIEPLQDPLQPTTFACLSSTALLHDLEEWGTNEKLDPVGLTVRHEVMKLCTGSESNSNGWYLVVRVYY